MTALRPLYLLCCGLGGALLAAAPALAEDARNRSDRGVFVTQIGDGSTATIAQQNGDSLARVLQDGDRNLAELTQKGTAAHRATIAQDGDDNVADAEQNGRGTVELTLAQEGSGNTALVMQRQTSASQTSDAAILQRGNDNSLVLVQDGSDNEASLTQLGDANTMTATQLDSGNRLQWTQDGSGLADLQIVQTGGANLQITQSNTGAQFAPPPGSGG